MIFSYFHIIFSSIWSKSSLVKLNFHILVSSYLPPFKYYTGFRLKVSLQHFIYKRKLILNVIFFFANIIFCIFTNPNPPQSLLRHKMAVPSPPPLPAACDITTLRRRSSLPAALWWNALYVALRTRLVSREQLAYHVPRLRLSEWTD